MELNSKVRYPAEIYMGNGNFRKETREGTLIKIFAMSSGRTFAVIAGSGQWRGSKSVILYETLLRYNPNFLCPSTKELDDWL